MSEPTRGSIVRTYQILAGLYTLAASLIWSVNTLFLLDAGLSISEVFVVNALFSFGMVLFEIPTGVVADTLGRRVSYLFSVGTLAATTLGYLVVAETGGNVILFSIVSILMGLGFTFYSGALEAWLVDALGFVDDTDGLDEVFARSQQVTGAAMLVGTPIGGFLGQADLALPFVARVVLLGALFVGSFRLMQEIGFTPKTLTRSEIPSAMREQAAVGVAWGWQQPDLRRLILAGLMRATFFGWAFYAAQPYFLELLDRNAIWVVGVITAFTSLAAIIGNQIAERWTRKAERRSTMIIAASAIATVASIVVGVADSFWVAVPAFLVVAAAMGVIAPVRQAFVHQVIPSEHRATVISFDGMIGSVGGASGQVALGRVADARSFSAGYIVGGAVTGLALPFLFALRRLNSAADFIADSNLPERPCAAAGLPREAQHDTRPLPKALAD